MLRFFGQNLTPQMKKVAEKFRQGIANALGVPPEEISEEKVKKWVEHWAKAFISPKYWSKYGLTAQEDVYYQMGYELGEILRDLL